MNNQFDELAKGMARSITRRGALKKFGVGLAGIALASLGLANKAEADPHPCLPGGSPCQSEGHCRNHCCSGAGYVDSSFETGKHWFCNY